MQIDRINMERLAQLLASQSVPEACAGVTADQIRAFYLQERDRFIRIDSWKVPSMRCSHLVYNLDRLQPDLRRRFSARLLRALSEYASACQPPTRPDSASLKPAEMPAGDKTAPRCGSAPGRLAAATGRQPVPREDRDAFDRFLTFVARVLQTAGLI